MNIYGPVEGGQHTNLGVASIVHPKPNDGDSGILSFLVQRFLCALAA